MSVLHVTAQGAVVRRAGRRVMVCVKDQVVADLPVASVERVECHGAVQLTSGAVALLLDECRPVCYLTRGGRYRGMLVPSYPSSLFNRMAQFERAQDESFCLAVARSLVRAKTSAACTLLARMYRDRHRRLDDVVLARSAVASRRAMAIPELMGIEGMAARRYFQHFGELLPEPFRFANRSRRPAQDPTNALLNLGYTLLTNAVAAETSMAGLDPDLGFLHAPGYSRPALAIDQVEPFRHPLVDRLVATMLAQQTITASDFVHDVDGPSGWRLSDAGFRRFVEAYSTRFDGTCGRSGDGPATFREALRRQLNSLVQAIRTGDAALFQPFRWRT